jgi:hypothetical protein
MTSRFRDYAEDQLRNPSLDSRCSPEERRARFSLIDAIMSRGGPVALDAAAESLGATEGKARHLVDSLVRKRLIVVNDAQCIEFAYPVSALPTAHRVTLADGRHFHAMCAIDALGTAFTFRQDVTVLSSCHRCGLPVSVSVHDGRLSGVDPAGLHAVHADLNATDNWAGGC